MFCIVFGFRLVRTARSGHFHTQCMRRCRDRWLERTICVFSRVWLRWLWATCVCVCVCFICGSKVDLLHFVWHSKVGLFILRSRYIAKFCVECFMAIISFGLGPAPWHLLPCELQLRILQCSNRAHLLDECPGTIDRKQNASQSKRDRARARERERGEIDKLKILFTKWNCSTAHSHPIYSEFVICVIRAGAWQHPTAMP